MNYLKREIYHCPTKTINIVSTRGKAGYRVWKFAGGQGDHDISLPLGPLVEILFFVLLESEVFVANPFTISQIKINTNKNKNKECI